MKKKAQLTTIHSFPWLGTGQDTNSDDTTSADAMISVCVRLATETEAREKAEGALKSAEQALLRKDGQLQTAHKEAKDLEKARREAEKECDELQRSLEQAKSDLDAETVNRVDAENNLQSMKETLTFKTQLFDQVRPKRSFSLSLFFFLSLSLSVSQSLSFSLLFFSISLTYAHTVSPL